MKSFVFNTLFTFAKMVLAPYVKGGFFNRVEALVFEYLTADLSGEEKRQKVFNWVKSEYGTINDILVNVAIELSVLKLVSPDKPSE